jgi:hypothetical protein
MSKREGARRRSHKWVEAHPPPGFFLLEDAQRTMWKVKEGHVVDEEG